MERDDIADALLRGIADGRECCSVCFRRGINADDDDDGDGAPPVDLGRCAAPGGFECRAVGQAVAGYRHENETLRSERDEARAQLAALREASVVFPALHRHVSENSAVVPLSARQWADFCAALADAAAAAEAHDREIGARTLEEAAARVDDGLRLWGRKAQWDAADWLRARAAERRGGER